VLARLSLALLTLAFPGLCYGQTSLPSELNWSGSLGLASGQVYRGLSLADEAIVPNINLVVEHSEGIYARAWLTRVELAGLRYETQGNMWQTLFDVGYDWRLTPDWAVQMAHYWYRYSEEVRDSSFNYREWAVSVDYGAYLTFDYAHTEDLWGLDTRQDVLTLSGRWPFTHQFIGEAALGWVEQQRENYPFLRLNAGYVLRDWSLQLQYHTTLGADLPYRDDRTGDQWVAQLNWHW
jgi:hypothetical protein